METGIDRKVSNRSFLDAINRDVDNGHINMTPTNIPDDLIPLIEALLGKSEMAIEMLEVVKKVCDVGYHAFVQGLSRRSNPPPPPSIAGIRSPKSKSVD